MTSAFTCACGLLPLPRVLLQARQTAWWRARFGAPRPPGGLRRRGAPPPPRATIDQVAAALQRMPTEVYATAAELEEMTVHDLKVKKEPCVELEYRLYI